MKTQAFTLARLRGVDLRYQVSPDSAYDVQDMRWTLNDSWTSCGGFRPITKYSRKYEPWGTVVVSGAVSSEFSPPTPGGGSTGGISPTTGATVSDNATIQSLHWFSQHNGARQFLIWEDDKGSYACKRRIKQRVSRFLCLGQRSRKRQRYR